jgi:hypothetical protein
LGNRLLLATDRNPAGASLVMAGPDDDAPRADEIDMDRVVIDPDYRRRVLARLRHDRQIDERRSAFADDAAGILVRDN